MIFKCVDHVGVAVTDLDRSIAWWSRLLDSEPFDRGTWLAAEIGDYVGTKVGYPNCDMSAAVWALPGGTVLELIEYHNPPPGRVDMETYNAGNAHFCFETMDIRADYERMREHAEFRSPDPAESVWGPYKGSLLWYLRDPDGITIELVQFAEHGRAYESDSPLGHAYAMDRAGPAG